MALTVTRQAIARMLAEAERAHPHEACGLLLGQGERITAIRPTANVHPEPARFFEIDPQALIDAHRAARDGDLQVLGYYHSHPNGLAEPSATDRAIAAPDGSVWAIIAAERISFWRSGDAGFEALPYEVAPR